MDKKWRFLTSAIRFACCGASHNNNNNDKNAGRKGGREFRSPLVVHKVTAVAYSSVLLLPAAATLYPASERGHTGARARTITSRLLRGCCVLPVAPAPAASAASSRAAEMPWSVSVMCISAPSKQVR